MAWICVKQEVILRNKRKWRLQDRLDTGCPYQYIDQLQREMYDHCQGIQKITQISDVVLPFLAAPRENAQFGMYKWTENG